GILIPVYNDLLGLNPDESDNDNIFEFHGLELLENQFSHVQIQSRECARFLLNHAPNIIYNSPSISLSCWFLHNIHGVARHPSIAAEIMSRCGPGLTSLFLEFNFPKDIKTFKFISQLFVNASQCDLLHEVNILLSSQGHVMFEDRFCLEGALLRCILESLEPDDDDASESPSTTKRKRSHATLFSASSSTSIKTEPNETPLKQKKQKKQRLETNITPTRVLYSSYAPQPGHFSYPQEASSQPSSQPKPKPQPKPRQQQHQQPPQQQQYHQPKSYTRPASSPHYCCSTQMEEFIHQDRYHYRCLSCNAFRSGKDTRLPRCSCGMTARLSRRKEDVKVQILGGDSGTADHNSSGNVDMGEDREGTAKDKKVRKEKGKKVKKEKVVVRYRVCGNKKATGKCTFKVLDDNILANLRK
ncbi:hypothetical protein HDU76_009912, partial [Blyttiomyces sp. JEL0837]